MKPVKLISWNVNGVRSVLRKGALSDLFAAEQPDLLCLQETKAEAEQVAFSPEGYQIFWNSAEKKGYSGTAVYSRLQPLSVQRGLGIEKHDREGRVLILEFASAYLVNVYTPNSKDALQRLAYRSEEWDVDFLARMQQLQQHKPVLICGDLNVAHKEIDLANPASNRRSAGFTDEERAGFARILAAGFVDSFRHFNQEPGQYSWWSYRTRARERNAGWRIDYFCLSQGLLGQLQAARIHQEIHGSDHCPVAVDMAASALGGTPPSSS